MTTFANVGGVADPRLGKEADALPNKEYGIDGLSEAAPPYSGGTVEGQYVGHDKNISFEEYHYYANWTRSYEKTLSTSGRGLASMKTMFVGKKNGSAPVEDTGANGFSDAAAGLGDAAGGHQPGMQEFGVISEYEWHHASRAARSATWGAVFYLITTDILGPFSVPWAISQLGYGPGVALYLVFGVLAG